MASGGGSRVTAWMAAVADATNLPVDTVAVPEGAALGAAYFARLAAGLETSLDDSTRWSAVGRTIEPDPAWVRAADVRYEKFSDLGHGRVEPAAYPLGVKATFKAPLWSWRARALRAGHHSSSPKRCVSIGRDVEPAVADQLEVERDGVEAAPLEVLHAEGVRAGDGDLLEVDRGRLPSFGRGHARVDEPAPLGQDAHAHLERLGLGDGVVDDVDVPGMGDGQPVQRLVQDGARPGGELLDELEPGLVGEDGVGPEAQRHGALGLEAGDDPDLDARVERLEDGHAREAEGAGAVDEHPPRGGRRVAHDGVEGDREGIGQHGGLVRRCRRGPGSAWSRAPPAARPRRRARR